MTHRLIVLVCLLGWSLVGCDVTRMKNGIAAFHSGDGPLALELLSPIIAEFKKVEPGKRICSINPFKKKKCENVEDCEAGDSAEEINAKITKKTALYFEAWRAYVGAVLMDENQGITEACEDIPIALRVFTVHFTGSKKFFERDPWEGDYWPAAVMELRSLWCNLPCPVPPGGHACQ